MSLDDRLRLARDEYRGLPSPALPAALTLSSPAGRRTLLLVAAAVVVIGGLAALALGLADEDDTSSLDVIGPDPSTPVTTLPERTVAVPDVTGLTVAEARSILGDVGLVLATHVGEGDLPDATVIAQEPRPGIEVTTGGAMQPSRIGVHTALPPPPEAFDCPAMSANRRIADDPDDDYDGLPPASGIGLDHVRTNLDNVRAEVDGSGVFTTGDGGPVDALGAYVGRGVLPGWDLDADGELTTTPDVGFQIVVEVATAGDCPDSPAALNETPVWFTVGWPSSAEAPAPSEQQPDGAIVERDPAITLDPAGPYTDGQEITVTMPEGYREDWVNDVPRLCVIVADDPAGPTETCDPLGVLTIEGTTETEVRLALSQRIFTPGGYRTCDEPTVVCRLVVWSAEDRWRASDALRFEGDPTPHSVDLEVSPGSEPGTIVLEPEGLAPHPSWLEARSRFTEGSEIGAFWIEVCAFGGSQADLAPYGEPLWTFSARADELPDANCETPPGAVIDPDDPETPLVVELPGRLHGYSGRSDCRTHQCFIVVSQTILDNDSEEPGLAGYSQRVTAALLRFDPDAELPAPPSLSILESGPHRAGDTVTVEIAGLPDGRTTEVGVCRVDQPWGCAYPLETWGAGNGTHQLVLPDTVAGCGPQQCYLELSGQGAGLPPYATVPLPFAQE